VAVGVDSRLEGIDSGLDLASEARGPTDRDPTGRGADVCEGSAELGVSKSSRGARLGWHRPWRSSCGPRRP
jgi:hypothetical protein